MAEDTSLDMSSAIRSTVDQMAQTGASIVLLEFPEPGVDAQEIIFRSELFAETKESAEIYRTHVDRLHYQGTKFLERLSSRKNVYHLPVLDILCDGDTCSVIDEGRVMYTDSVHPSVFYSDLVATKLLNEYSQLEDNQKIEDQD